VTEAPARVLFVSTGGACRALFAQALLRRIGGSTFEAWSCGTDPSPIDPLTLEVLGRAGVDASGLAPQPLADLVGQPFEYVITLCDDARLVCPCSRAPTSRCTGATPARRGRPIPMSGEPRWSGSSSSSASASASSS
jgi:protein-tyrosine-phosphatase